MDLRHLQTFKTIADEGSFVKAADKLQYAQSTLTLQIQQLEEELGIELFDRQRKKIQLTPAGQALLVHAVHVLSQVEQMHQDIRDLATGESGHLRVGLIEPVAQLYLPEVLESFCRCYPRIRLTVEVLGTMIVPERVATGSLDLGVSTLPPAEAGLVFEPLVTEPMVVLMAKDHPLQQQDRLSLRDLDGERILLTNPPCAYRTVVEQAFMAQGMNVPPGIEVGSITAIKQCVRRGLGIAIIPMLAASPAPSGTVIKTLEDWSFHLPIGLLRKSASAMPGRAIETFASLLKRAMCV